MAQKSNRKASGVPSGPIGILAVLAVGVVIVLAISFLMTDETPVSATDPAGDIAQDQRPTGAGTNPDGAIDETTEGLTNQTAADDLIDSTAATDPNPLEESVGSATNPATSAEGLEPAQGSGNVERMLPDEETSGDGSASGN